MIAVDAAAWRDVVRGAQADGYTFFEWLGCVDEIGRGGLRVVVALRNLATDQAPRLIGTELPREDPRLDSIRDVFAGAAWHEREVAELFGVEFVGGDRRRLLLPADFDGTPMRKDVVLAARTGLTWPGAKEPGETAASPGRRRMVPPGVPDSAVWGDRAPDVPDAKPEDVAAATAGGRVRRRPP
jgi:NADH-quinone oxidoreductase subunit C